MGPKGVALDLNGHITVVDSQSIFTFQPNCKLVGQRGDSGAIDGWASSCGCEQE